MLDDHTYMRRAVSACLGEAGIQDVLEVESIAAARQQVRTAAHRGSRWSTCGWPTAAASTWCPS